MLIRSLRVAALIAAVGTLASAQAVSGFYAGGSLGSDMGKLETKATLGGQWATESAGLRNDVVAAWSKDLDANGFQASLRAGYRQVMSNGFVVGGELNIGLLKSEKTLATGPVSAPSVPTLKYALDAKVAIKTPTSLVAQFGYAVNEHLPYLILGFTSAKVETSSQIVSNGDYRKLANASETRSGFQWGLGYEYTINRNLALSGELTSVNLGDSDVVSAYLPGSTFTNPVYTETFNYKVTLTSFRLGVSYRF